MEKLTQDLFDKLCLQSTSFIIFKHSPTCGISGTACRQVGIALSEISVVNIFMINVLDQRSFSQKIAQQTNIKHESPQIIIFKEGKAVADASHFDITTVWLEDMIQKHGIQ